MTPAPAPQRMSYADYLALEGSGQGKHEWLDGEILAMTGASPRHVLVTMNLGAALHRGLRGGPCRAFASDLRVRVPSTGRACYPDLVAICGALEHPDDDPYAVTNPTLIVEVLSPSTEANDRGAKFADYQTLPRVVQIVFVDPTGTSIERYAREDEGWRYQRFGAGQTVSLAGVDIAVDEVYEGADAL